MNHTYKLIRSMVVFVGLGLPVDAIAQIGLPTSAIPAARDTIPLVPPAPAPPTTPAPAPPVKEAPLTLRASVSQRTLHIQRGDSAFKTYSVAVGTDRYPTPRGTFRIKKIVWNPSWRPPPGADWARGKIARGPGDPKNPMKVAKIFFQEPDYYIHGTGDVESLGSAASHGCLRMDPEEVAEVARLIMEHGGQPREENWFWRIIHSRREEKVVYLRSPVYLTIDA